MSLLASTSKGLSVTISLDGALGAVATGAWAAFASSACIAAISSGSSRPLLFLSYLASVAAFGAAACAQAGEGLSKATANNADASKLAAEEVDTIRGVFMVLSTKVSRAPGVFVHERHIHGPRLRHYGPGQLM